MPMFDGPIPGQSLTRPVGGRPYEQPARFNTIDDAMNYLVPNMLKEENAMRLVATMAKKRPISGIVDTLLQAGFAEGMWTPDVALMLVKPVGALLISMAHNAGVDYNLGAEKESLSDFLTKLSLAIPDDEAPPPALQPGQGGFMDMGNDAEEDNEPDTAQPPTEVAPPGGGGFMGMM